MPDLVRRILGAAPAVEQPLTPPGYMLVTDADYEMLLELASANDMLIICEVCGAWMYRDDDACATANDFSGCWKAATGGKIDLCMSHRAPNRVTDKERGDE